MFRFGFIFLAVQPVVAQAQCQLCASAAVPQLARSIPLRIDVTTTLDLGRAAQTRVNGAGAIALDAGGQRRVTGSLADLGGLVLTGTVRLQGEPFAPVLIALPQRVTLFAPDGSSADVTDIRTDNPAVAMLNAQGMLTVNFGGRISVNGGISGDFRGQISITADYR